MVKFALQIQATLENLTNLKPDQHDFLWSIKFKCTNCHEITDKWQYFNDKEEQELKNSRGTAHFIMKCKFCSRENNLSVINNSLKEYNIEDSEQFKTICEFDCRSIEPVEFNPNKYWFAMGVESNTPFKQIDLEKEDFVDYDEKVSESVGIYEMKGQFVKVK